MKAAGFMREVRDYLVGEHGRYVFEARRTAQLPLISRADLYIHIPFCRSLCPYCPYNRVLYEKEQVEPYLRALLCEIDAYRAALGPIEIGSIYIGGGTPTAMLDGLGTILEYLRKRFTLAGEIAVETIPSDLNDNSYRKLKEYGVNLLSIGIQSFNDRYLKLIGRNYRSGILPEVIRGAYAAGFDAVNLDLMFAFPGQTLEEALADLQNASDLGSDQITFYPLFTFPYTSIGEHMRLRQVRFPRLLARRKMYKALHDAALSNGFSPISVWGFRRGDAPRFSSVTRNYYIGLGPGAGSRLPHMFYFNTFSVPEYVQACGGSSFPVALSMEMTPVMENYYWLYWRLYETCVPKDELFIRFPRDVNIKRIFRLGAKLGLMSDGNDHFVLTERGAFWIHLLQNYYVLNYVDKVWSSAMREPWPERIEL